MGSEMCIRDSLYFIVNENVLMKQSLNDDVFNLNVFENNVVEDIFSDGDYLYVSLSNDKGRKLVKVDREQGMIIKQVDLANNKMLAGVDEAGWFWFYVDMALRSSLNRLYSH